MGVVEWGGLLGRCLDQAHVTPKALAIDITTPSTSRSDKGQQPNPLEAQFAGDGGQTLLADIIWQVVRTSEWSLEDKVIPVFLGCCCRRLTSANQKDVLQLALYAALASFDGFGGLPDFFSNPLPRDPRES